MSMRPLALVLALSWPLAVDATKPCMADPCASDGRFDASRCERLAAWVATARLESVEHHREGPPLSKDFAVFVVRVEKWEKGKASLARLRFQVGWCNNRQGPPDQIGARLRIYGEGEPTAEAPQYLGLEVLP